MWNQNNAAVVDRYGGSSGNPPDAEYGTYIMREMMSLGFPVKKLGMTGGNFMVVMDLMDGLVRVVLLCKSAKTVIDASSAQALMAMRSICKATRYCIVTNRSFPSAARQAAAQNKILLVEDFYVGSEILDLLAAVGIMPRQMSNMMVNYRIDAEERAAAEAEEAERRRQEEEAHRKKEFEEQEVRQMTPMEKYRNGLYDSRMPEAIAVCAQTDVISVGGLARKMRIDQDEARVLLTGLHELGVIGVAERAKPREVLMTSGMIEKKFGIRVNNGLR